ncbi:MAG: hypothetical protein UR26_C0002G0182 [candidate division TM6 bacterium GW2011_GWF2_32_72]|nr:MAG: hypothetical protein UR26_C0002G0182 [candidate division TM6 bacterium GW2011_GWF2_32_72]
MSCELGRNRSNEAFFMLNFRKNEPTKKDLKLGPFNFLKILSQALVDNKKFQNPISLTSSINSESIFCLSQQSFLTFSGSNFDLFLMVSN